MAKSGVGKYVGVVNRVKLLFPQGFDAGFAGKSGISRKKNNPPDYSKGTVM